MRNHRFAFFIASVLLVSCHKNVPRPMMEKPALAVPSKSLIVHTILTHRRDSTVNATDTTTHFDMRDTIHGIIETQNALDGMTLLGKWYFVKTGQLVAQNSATLSAGTNLSHFDLLNAHPWPPGKYKLYVLVDSILKDSAHFTVENKR